MSFNGLCRFGDKKKNDMMSKRTISPLICQEWCQDTKNCVAFDFAKSRTRDCTLYQGGPYTYGWEMYKKKDLNKCYLMPTKGIFFKQDIETWCKFKIQYETSFEICLI